MASVTIIHIACAFRGRKSELRFESEVVIGRRERPADAEVTLDLTDDNTVSRRHARIWAENGKCWIRDLDSRGGTIVADKSIRGLDRFELVPGVVVRVGQTTLLLLELVTPRPSPRAEVRCAAEFNYSLALSDVPFIESVTLANDGSLALDDVELRIVLPGYAESQPVKVHHLPAGGSCAVLPPPRFPFDRASLRDLPVAEVVALEVFLDEMRVPLEPPVAVTILPPNAWHCCGHEAALAGFVMPDSDAIDEVTGRARFELRRLLKGAQSWADALQSVDPAAVVKTLKALYYCLQERYSITYEYEPRTYGIDWQAVRFHEDVVLAELEGTCIDLTVLFAACLEHVHRDPLIIVVEVGPKTHHAIVGCWRHETRAQGAVLSNQSQLRGWVKSGEVLVVDCMGFPRTSEAPSGKRFSEARRAGIQSAMRFPLVYAVDVVTARYTGFAPMPFGKGVRRDRGAWLALYRSRRRAEARGDTALTARHLLLGLLELENGLLRQALARIGDGVPDQVAAMAEQSLASRENGGPSEPRVAPRPTDDWDAVSKRAEERPRLGEAGLVTEADLTLALLETPSQAQAVLNRCGLSVDACIDAVNQLLNQHAVPSVWHSSGFSL